MFANGAVNPPPNEPGGEISETASEEKIDGCGINRAIDVWKSKNCDKKTNHRVAVPSKPIQIALGAVFAHEEHDASAAVQRGNRQQIERAEEEIQRKESAEDITAKVRTARERILVQPAHGPTEAEADSGDEHERVVCRPAQPGPSRRHGGDDAAPRAHRTAHSPNR